MATKVRFTRQDLLQGRLLEPGWYPMKVSRIIEKPASTDKSTNFIVSLENLKEGDDQGVVVTLFANEKAPGALRPLLEALNVDVEADKDYDIYAIVGETVNVYVDRLPHWKTQEPTNTPKMFRSMSEAAAT